MSKSTSVIAELFIRGIPYPQEKSRGDLEAPEKWSDEIVRQTMGFPTVTGPCELEVLFVLPENKFPENYRYGGDLDNYVKWLNDALEKTVLKDAPGGDSAIVVLHARKRRVREGEETGARIILRRANPPL